MKFCTQCDNKLYIRVKNEEADILVYYCRFCGYEEDATTSAEGTTVLKTQFGKRDPHLHYNRYTKQDPTLPRIYNMECPNGECSSRVNPTETKSEIIYIRYDEENMKYLYLCVHCDAVWKTDDRK
jgi:DNA-directed RNA polymerase subunit M/transcription elongation factor TFIIS